MSDLKNGIAGGLAGIAVDIVFYPLETIKTRIMATSLKQNIKDIALSKFKGFSAQMIVSFPYAFTFFFVYQKMRQKFGKTALVNVFASASAEIAGNIVRNPFEVIKQQMMVGRSIKVGQSLKLILKQKGFKGFYIGYRSTLMRDIIFSIIQLPLFEYSRKYLQQHFGYTSVTSASIGGMIAACLAGFISCPLDVIKTRLMTQKMNQQGSINAIKQVYSDYGFRGFFRGVGFRCGILSFGGIIYFGALQKSRVLLNIQ